MKVRFNLFLIFLGLSVSVVPTLVLADSDAENTTLAQIVHELDAIQPLINKAQQEQPISSQIRFNYSQLQRDIKNIKEGILQKLTKAYLEPRTFEPIKGDYVDVESMRP